MEDTKLELTSEQIIKDKRKLSSANNAAKARETRKLNANKKLLQKLENLKSVIYNNELQKPLIENTIEPVIDNDDMENDINDIDDMIDDHIIEINVPTKNPEKKKIKKEQKQNKTIKFEEMYAKLKKIDDIYDKLHEVHHYTEKQREKKKIAKQVQLTVNKQVSQPQPIILNMPTNDKSISDKQIRKEYDLYSILHNH